MDLPGTRQPEAVLTTTLVGISLPIFVTGLLLIYAFAFRLRWFPTSGAGSWHHLVLPPSRWPASWWPTTSGWCGPACSRCCGRTTCGRGH
jgi:ABC-type dipeptide/oligopeptide/nickel transport system permease component